MPDGSETRFRFFEAAEGRCIHSLRVDQYSEGIPHHLRMEQTADGRPPFRILDAGPRVSRH
ncbi:MAG: hypothetical protein QF473_24650, partial [Planctomycetota bacterium]|nr:hypothetical protein [Planctomycetota bacterium]